MSSIIGFGSAFRRAQEEVRVVSASGASGQLGRLETSPAVTTGGALPAASRIRLGWWALAVLAGGLSWLGIFRIVGACF